MHDQSIFATLTYSPDHLPGDGQLAPRDVTLFLYRLRAALASGNAPAVGTRVRYLLAGEYGEQFNRPHYHALLFGIRPTDGYRCGGSDERPLFNSPWLEAIWRLGNVQYGDVTVASACYTAQYTLKKQRLVADADGVVLLPPFLRVSTRPGIGAGWVDRFQTDLRHGYAISDGSPVPVPRYYLKKASPEISAEISENRQYNATKIQTDAKTPDRLRDAEEIHQSRLTQNTRNF